MSTINIKPTEYRIIQGYKSRPVEFDPVKTKRLAVIGGVLMLSVLAGTILGGVDPLYGLVVVAAPLAVVGLLYFLGRFDLAPLLVLLAAAFLPVGVPTGTGSKLVASLVLTLVFTGIWFMRMVAVEKRFYLEPTSLNIPLFGFMIATVVSLLWSNLLRDPLVNWRTFSPVQLASTVVMIMLPGAFLLMINHVKSRQVLMGMTGLMLLAGTIGLVKQYEIVYLPINTGGMFTMWIISLSAGLAIFWKRLHPFGRLILLGLTGVWVIWGFVLHISWLAGWLPGLAALGVLTAMRSKKMLIAIALVGAVIFFFNSDYYLGKVLGNESNESGGTRLAAWEVNWRVTGQHLLFGTGPAGYASYYMSYFPHDAMATHSNYVDIVAETGLVGFAFYIWFFIALTWKGYKLCLRLKNRGDFYESLANAALAGTVAGIVAMAIGDWLIPFAYTQTIAGFDYSVYCWLFMGAIVVIDKLTKEEVAAGKPAIAVQPAQAQ
ncbi:MAG: O-antigen ligase family protein [Chloroflexi bacterium]|nr:O-antigen ligase family protein [Chloroflexota bacterium]